MRVRKALAAIVVGLFLYGCAHSLNVLDRVRPGQSESEAVSAVGGAPGRTVEGEGTKYLLWGFIATFLDMYSETVTHYYVKLEGGRVVDKGILRGEIIDDIRKIEPQFPLTR